jgi:acetone carboxylase gamma subunit
MAARIKVDAYPFGQFGSVPAQVRQIVSNDDDSDNFTMTLELLQDSIKADEDKIQLFSGLTVQAEVQTRNQRLFELLFSQ